LDSNDSITTFSRKDLSIVTAISNQTAIAIENSILMAEYEQNAKVKEHLSRFLAPHVVQKMSNPSEIIRKGGRQLVGTIIFVDIRGFTNMSEKSTPVEVVHLLNDYFERVRMIDVVGTHCLQIQWCGGQVYW
jgi:adenylate cyclase